MSFVASGTYGCVFKPHLPCDKKKINKPKGARTISKVFRDKKEASIEQKINDVLNKVDPHNEFTIPLYDACVLSKDEVKNKDELLSCKHIKPKIENQQLIFKYGGISLHDYLKHTKFTTTKFKQLLVALAPIFEGVQKLHDKRYVHLDIKPANILYMPSSKKAYLIDFGLMTQTNKVFQKDKKAHILKHPYPFYPPEFKMIYEKSFQDLKSIMNRSLKLDITTDTQSMSYKTALASCGVDIDKGISEMLKLKKTAFTYKIDSYSLGVSLCHVLAWIPKDNKFTKKTLTIINNLKNIINQLCEPISVKRPGVAEAFILYKKFNKEF